MMGDDPSPLLILEYLAVMVLIPTILFVVTKRWF